MSLSPLLLCVLALLDASLAGFRDAAGRNPLLFKRRYQILANIRGLLVGAGMVSIGIFSFLIALWLSPTPWALLNAYLKAGQAMCWVYGSYAMVALLSLSVYLSSRPEISSLATVLILGPFTLARPLVILAGALYGIWVSPQLPIIITISLGAGLLMGIGPLLNLWKLNPRTLEEQSAECRASSILS